MENEDTGLMTRDRQLKVILFDLGGVLLRLNDPVEIFGLDIDESEFKHRWISSPCVRTFETGGMETEEFAKRVVIEAALPYEWQEFIERFDSWADRLFDETIAVLEAIPPSYKRALLSNINALHWGRDDIAGKLQAHIDETFLSFETGVMKPDRAAFELVVKSCDCLPGEVLFFDDHPINVSAAADYGIQAVHAEGIDAARQTLIKRGVIS